MKKVQIGRSDVYVTPVTYGAWAIGGWMWGGADEKDAIEALETSLDLGMSSIDTAPVYGFGKSEELVGKAIQGKRDKVEILTKYGLKWDDRRGEFYFETVHNDGNKVKLHKYAGRESVMNECEDSLRRLKTDYIDLYQIHWADPTTPVEETMEAVERLIEQGKVRAAGVCNYDSALTKRASENILLASDQVPYSMVNRDIENDLVPWCIEHNVAILAYSPLQRGLLTGKITPDYEFGKGDHRPKTPYFKTGNIRKVNGLLEDIKPIADSKDATLSQLVLAWTIAQPGITVALAGARNRKQVEDNAGAMTLNLSKEEVDEITTKLDHLDLDL